MDLKYEFKYCSDEIEINQFLILPAITKNEFSLGDPVVDVD